MTNIVVSSGQTSSGITVTSGGILDVIGGGVALNTTVFLSSFVFVETGAVASNTVLRSTAEQFVFSGGIAIGTMIQSGGLERVLQGGTVSAASIGSGGVEQVLSGADAIDVTVSSGGLQTVFGRASGSEVLSGGQQVVSGLSVDTVVRGGGLEIVASGGTASATTLQTGAIELVSGGTADGTELDSGSFLVLVDGGTAKNSHLSGGTVTSSGVLVYDPANGASYSAAPVSGHYLGSGSLALVLASGMLAAATVAFGAEERIYSGGTGSGATIDYGGTETVFSGGVSDYAVVSGGAQVISSGGIASHADVVEFGSQTVAAGATALLTTIGAYSLQMVAGGTASATRVASSGTQVISAGGLAVGDTVDFGGTVEVLGGGTVSGGLLHGHEVVEAGGQAVGVVVDSQALQYVEAGATASGITVQSGGLQILEGSEDGLVLGSGGYGVETASSTLTGVVSSGGIIVSSGVLAYSPEDGVTYAPDVLSGYDLDAGVLFAFQGGVVSGATLSGTYETRTSATLFSGAVMKDSFITSFTSVFVDKGATIEGVVTQGGQVFVGGVANGDTVGQFSLQVIESGGLDLNGNVVGGQEWVTSGGLASGTVVASSGSIVVFAEGTTEDVSVTSGAFMLEYYGGVAQATAVEDGGYIYVSGTTSGTVIGRGGIEGVTAVGSALGTVIDDGGWQIVGQGAHVSGTTIHSGGVQLVLPGTTTTGTVVDAGGSVVSTGVSIIRRTPGPDAGGSFYGSVASGQQVVSGTIFALAGGTVEGGSIGGGALSVRSGGAASGVTLTGSATSASLYDGAGTTGDIFNGGATEYVFSGAVASGSFIGSSSIELIDIDGRAVRTEIAAGGLMYVGSAGLAQGAVIDSGGSAHVYAGGAAEGFDVRSGGLVSVDASSGISNVMIENGGALDLAYVAYAASEVATYDPASHLLRIGTGSVQYDISLMGDYSSSYFDLASDGTGGTTVTMVTAAPCFCPGTRILTDSGEVAVEDLRIGDMLVLHGGGVRPLRWIGRRSYDGRFIAGRDDMLPVTFRAGSLGDGLPNRDLSVSPLHAMFLHGVLVPARALLNGISIFQHTAVDSVSYLHLELLDQHIIIANGTPTESFVDDDSRALFQNADEFHLLYPDEPRLPAAFCAGRQEDGELVDEIRQRLVPTDAASDAAA